MTFYSVVLGITLLSPMNTPYNKPTYKLRSFMDPPCTPSFFLLMTLFAEQPIILMISTALVLSFHIGRAALLSPLANPHR